MTEKIKIVYSWIGPKGPIWNTELPNILSLAGSSEGGGTTSRHWWAEDNYAKLFGKSSDYFEIYPAISIEADHDKRPFIFPFSLTWRIEFEKYFFSTTGIIEFSHMPLHLLPMVRGDNGYILINHSVEAFMSDGQLNAMHGYFRDHHGIPLYKIIYVTGTMNASAVYEDYCLRHNVPDTPYDRLTVISYPSSIDIFNVNMERPEDEPVYNENVIPEKLFLMWNRRYRSHRIEMALNLEHAGAIDRSYISFPARHVEMNNVSFENALDRHYINHAYPYISDEDINRFASKLPLILDGEEDINQMCEDRENTSRPFYQNSLVSIITETNYNNMEVTLTEKSFKPLKEKHPFIIVGVNGALKAMRDLGFKTFSEFWDESYDDYQDPQQRMRHLFNVVDAITKWTPEQILDFRRRVKPILEHNYQLLKNSSSDIIVANQIRELIERHRV